MIFQEPIAALNPVFTIGSQIVAAIRAHARVGKADAQRRAVELLRKVGIPDPDSRMAFYPHQLSGGMCQRVMIAMALAAGARLVIADEPTTALDVTIQAEIVKLLRATGARHRCRPAVHQPRSRPCRRALRSCRRRLCRRDRRDRRERRAAAQAVASLHAGPAALCGPPRRCRPSARRNSGRAAVAGRVAAGLPVSGAMLICGRRLRAASGIA